MPSKTTFNEAKEQCSGSIAPSSSREALAHLAEEADVINPGTRQERSVRSSNPAPQAIVPQMGINMRKPAERHNIAAVALPIPFVQRQFVQLIKIDHKALTQSIISIASEGSYRCVNGGI